MEKVDTVCKHGDKNNVLATCTEKGWNIPYTDKECSCGPLGEYAYANKCPVTKHGEICTRYCNRSNFVYKKHKCINGPWKEIEVKNEEEHKQIQNTCVTTETSLGVYEIRKVTHERGSVTLELEGEHCKHFRQSTNWGIHVNSDNVISLAIKFLLSRHDNKWISGELDNIKGDLNV